MLEMRACNMRKTKCAQVVSAAIRHLRSTVLFFMQHRRTGKFSLRMHFGFSSFLLRFFCFSRTQKMVYRSAYIMKQHFYCYRMHVLNRREGARAIYPERLSRNELQLFRRTHAHSTFDRPNFLCRCRNKTIAHL